MQKPAAHRQIGSGPVPARHVLACGPSMPVYLTHPAPAAIINYQHVIDNQPLSQRYSPHRRYPARPSWLSLLIHRIMTLLVWGLASLTLRMMASSYDGSVDVKNPPMQGTGGLHDPSHLSGHQVSHAGIMFARESRDQTRCASKASRSGRLAASTSSTRMTPSSSGTWAAASSSLPSAMATMGLRCL